MFLARLICPDPDCAAELETEGATIEELEAYLCECGCVMEIVGWPDWIDQQALLVGVDFGRDDLPEAA